MNHDEIKQVRVTLKLLESLADKACKAAFKQRKNINGAINWGDLYCAEVGYVVTLEREHYLVLIEEANPSSSELCAFIARHITVADKGFDPSNLDVRTEW